MPNKENSAFRPTRGSVRAIVATLIATVALVLMPSPPAGATAVGAVGQGGVSANVVFGPMSAKWWKWLAEQPASANPYLSTDGTNCGQAQQPGPVFFLAGYPKWADRAGRLRHPVRQGRLLSDRERRECQDRFDGNGHGVVASAQRRRSMAGTFGQGVG